MVTRLRAERPENRSSILSRTKVVYSTASRLVLGLAQPPIISFGLKWLECEAVNQPPSNVNFKNAYLYLHYPILFLAWCLI
jgi:hypothetical protein